MAWPVTSRYQSFVDGITNIIAGYLHAVQDAIINIYGGKRTLVSVDVDGIGDQASALGPGEIRAGGNLQAGLSVLSTKQLSSSTARSSATPGSGQSVALGEVWKDTACFAWAHVTVNAAGPSITLVRGANIASVVRNGIGDYTVTLQTAAPNRLIPIATAIDDAFSTMMVIDRASLTTSVIKLLMRDPAGQVDPNNANGGFMLVVFAG